MPNAIYGVLISTMRGGVISKANLFISFLCSVLAFELADTKMLNKPL